MGFFETVSKVIDLADRANAARAKRASTDAPFVTSGVQFGPPSRPSAYVLPTAEEMELTDFLNAQSDKVVYLLLALMYLGRGDFDASRFKDYSNQNQSYGDPRLAVRQMADKVVLPMLLRAGLARATNAGVDLDGLLAQ